MKKSKKVLAGSVAAITAFAVTSAPVFAARDLAGSSRYETAVNVAKAGWTTSDYAVLAPGEDAHMVDALASAPLAKAYNAPVLLTWSTDLHQATLTELKTLGVKTVFITSGTISETVKTKLKAAGINIKNVYGSDRYETSVKIAEEVKAKLGKVNGVMLSSGSGIDAVSAGSVAAAKGMPILYTYANVLPTSVKNFATANPGTNFVLGGAGVVSDSIKDALKATRVAGTSRYETSAAILNQFKAELDLSTIYVAPGNDANIIDALSISALAAKGAKANPVVLTASTIEQSEMKATVDFLKANIGNATVKVVGNAVTQAVEDGINKLKNTTVENKITNIKVESGLTAFDRYVELTVQTSNPDKTTIKYGNTTFKYEASKKVFIAVVPTADEVALKDASKYTLTVESDVVTPPVTDTVKVKEVKVESGLTAFDRYVELSLDTTTPENYTVKFGNTELKYEASKKVFINVVPSSDEAKLKDVSSYTVTKK